MITKLSWLSASILMLLMACSQQEPASGKTEAHDQLLPVTVTGTSLVILGTIQDAGSPHMGCRRDCCRSLWEAPDPLRKVVSLGLIDPLDNKKYLIEATPDFPSQCKTLLDIAGGKSDATPDGIFLTHAHIGHYTGLMHLGREALGASGVPVYAMPRMKTYLEDNGPWSQLVNLGNISLKALEEKSPVRLTSQLEVSAFTVPHRDEYSETVGYTISGPKMTAVFIPDIDKWEKWDTDILQLIRSCDYAFLDGSFYSGVELGYRDMSEIPHPSLEESMALFKNLDFAERSKVYFIHFNHTNPVLRKESSEYKSVIEAGFNIASMGDVFTL